MTQNARLRVIGSEERRPPPVPAEADLRELPKALIDIDDLSNSMFAATSTPEGFKAAWRLYGNAIRQLPAGSLPDDDRKLAFLAGYGMDVSGWRAVRQEVLEAWTLHADGRYYRRDLAITVLASWISRLSDQEKQAKGVAKKKGVQHDEELFQRPIQVACTALHALDPRAKILRNHMRKQTADQPDIVPLPVVPDIHPDTVSDTHKRSEAKRSQQSGQSPEPLFAVHAQNKDQETVLKQGTRPIEKPDEWPPDAFEQFKAAWPGDRVPGWRKSAEIIRRLARRPPVPWSAFLAALDRYGGYGRSQGSRFKWRNPQTWLNDAGWDARLPSGGAASPLPQGGPAARQEKRNPFFAARESILADMEREL